jgi:hypothetical protein
MEQDDSGVMNVNALSVKPKIHRRLVPPFTLLSILAVLIFAALTSTYPVHATGGDNETGATVAPGGASLGSAGSGTNVTQSDCLSQNATINGSSIVGAGGANATTTNNTTATVAPSGASIGANDTRIPQTATGNTTTTTNNTTATVAPSGASLC